MGVGDRIDDRHRPGQGEFELPACVSAGDCGLECVDALLTPQRSGDCRHFRGITIIANAHCDPPRKIDTLDVFEKAVHKVLTRLLAIGDDIDPGVLLLLDHQQRGVALRLNERLALQLPTRPQYPRLGQPSRFRQAARDRRLKHVTLPFLLPRHELSPDFDRSSPNSSSSQFCSRPPAIPLGPDLGRSPQNGLVGGRYADTISAGDGGRAWRRLWRRQRGDLRRAA